MLLETKFGMGVNIAPNGAHLSVITGQVVDQRARTSFCCRPHHGRPGGRRQRHRPS